MMPFSAIHLLLLLLAPFIVTARPADPIQSTTRDARQLLAPVQYLPMVQSDLHPDYRYGYNPLITRAEAPSDDVESRIGLMLLLLLLNGFDDRITWNRPLANRPFLNRPSAARPFGARP